MRNGITNEASRRFSAWFRNTANSWRSVSEEPQPVPADNDSGEQDFAGQASATQPSGPTPLSDVCRVPDERELREIANRAAVVGIPLEEVLAPVEAIFNAQRLENEQLLDQHRREMEDRADRRERLRSQAVQSEAAVRELTAANDAVSRHAEAAAATVAAEASRVGAWLRKRADELAVERSTAKRDERWQAGSESRNITEAAVSGRLAAMRQERPELETRAEAFRRAGIGPVAAVSLVALAIFSLASPLALLTRTGGADWHPAVWLAGGLCAAGLAGLLVWCARRCGRDAALAGAGVTLLLAAFWLLLAAAGGGPLLLAVSLAAVTAGAGLLAAAAQRTQLPHRDRLWAAPLVPAAGLAAFAAGRHPVADAIALFACVVAAAGLFGVGIVALTQHAAAAVLRRRTEASEQELAALRLPPVVESFASVVVPVLGAAADAAQNLRPEDVLYPLLAAAGETALPAPLLALLEKRNTLAGQAASALQQLHAAKAALDELRLLLHPLEDVAGHMEAQNSALLREATRRATLLEAGWQNARLQMEQAYRMSLAANGTGLHAGATKGTGK